MQAQRAQRKWGHTSVAAGGAGRHGFHKLALAGCAHSALHALLLQRNLLVHKQ